ncbi:helix-turn-helix domain-containing protein [Candidatus Peregrinibacteria bacterium]|jgi:excisionase family DNA binding protein|nr:helix-turn-helix domain-containing protein [Candidatus Peregrinibacteria bacterium]
MQKIYTPEQVGAMLQLHPLTITKYIKKGKLKASRIGRIYRITESAVQQFLEDLS